MDEAVSLSDSGAAAGSQVAGDVDASTARGADDGRLVGSHAGASDVAWSSSAGTGVLHGADAGESDAESGKSGRARGSGTGYAKFVGVGEGSSGGLGSWGRVWWVGVGLALLGVGAVRAAGWLFGLCVVGAAVAASLGVVGRRSRFGVLYDVIAVPVAAVAAMPWVYAGIGRMRGGMDVRRRRIGVSVGATVVLLAVFVPLLAGADATFAALVGDATPRIDVGSAVRWCVVFGGAAAAAIGAIFLLAGPPVPASDAAEKVSGRPWRRIEWALPVGALTVLFAVFVGAQFVALFGGDDYVQRTAGLTYAEYARSGFWQLSAVTILTLAVVLAVLRRSAQDSVADRLWLRVLLCAVGGLTLIIVASALSRMWTYQQAYGFTVLRLLVQTCELWLGLVYLLVLVAVLRLERNWLPRATIGTAMVTLLALAALNPEGLIADRNIDRWQHGKELDTEYLGKLSPDIVPALDRLPEPMRAALLADLRHRLDDDTWQSWNWARRGAR
ncbi:MULTISPECIES: DUF4153 domain-containing protein [unclassified Nocardia]|uniref:DUF4153 domain-containing protein n=1 Tax=unclassified Nocardia TaxID=2637762 RepID=UPI001CE40593|nr:MULTISPECIES: DUF4173 domain-containing protein [unclassified Nocardia]